MSTKYEALCISAGGVKGFCALGALQYMQDHHRLDVGLIKYLSGTSIGSAIAFFIAIGYTPIELMVYMCTHKMFESLKFKSLDEIFTGDGIYDYSTIHKEAEKMCIAKLHYIPTMKQLFDTTGVHLTIATYNLTVMKLEYLSHETHPDLSCLDAIRMSCNLPFLFSPFVKGNHEFIDGAFIDGFPVSPLPYKEKKTVGIYLDDTQASAQNDSGKAKKNKLYEISAKILRILTIPTRELHKHLLENIKPFIDIITIEVEDVPVYRFDLRKEERLDLFSLGYTKAKQFFESDDEECVNVDDSKQE